MVLGGAITSAESPESHESQEATTGKLALATCQFPVAADISKNADWIRRQMKTSASQGADLVHFSECALSGYAGIQYKSLDGFDWNLLRAETKTITDLAKKLKLWVVLGSAHPLSGDHRPHNSLYVINDQGKIVDRYDKRFCTSGDLRHYSPGDHFVVFDINGVRCGLLICYDIRFPELYREYQKREVRLMLHSFHNANMEPGMVHPIIMPTTGQARAATNHMFVSMNNSSVPISWPSLLVSPDGLVVQRLALNRPGVMVHQIDVVGSFYDASQKYRADAMSGKLNSGETVEDPRSKDRTGL